MSCKRACFALLVLQVLGAGLARPSDGAQGDGALELSANLLNRSTIFNACPRPPDVLSTPSEVAGDWCGLQNSQETNPPASCNRLTFLAVGNDLRAILNSLENGEIVVTKNVTFSQIENQSWLSRFEGRTTNLFVGKSADRKLLHICGTTLVGEGTPQEVSSFALARCLEPGDEAAAAAVRAGERPNVERCELPQRV